MKLSTAQKESLCTSETIKGSMMWITTGAALLKPSLLSHCLLITFNFLTILYCQGRIILDLDTAASDVSDISEHINRRLLEKMICVLP